MSLLAVSARVGQITLPLHTPLGLGERAVINGMASSCTGQPDRSRHSFLNS